MIFHNFWIMLPVLLPLAGGAIIFVLPTTARPIGLFSIFGSGFAVIGLIRELLVQGPLRYSLGNWNAPLGIELYCDGLSALMLAMLSFVGAAVSLYATAYFPAGTRKSENFWSLWLFLFAALNALFLSSDIFNLYVTLEMLGLCAVALVALAGNALALSGAMRYLLSSLLASLFFLLGVALFYHSFGTVDIVLLSLRFTASQSAWAALSLMTAGLLLKSALFPLHFWLPPAHASAPGPVSALLSALVVKASFYILLRLWINIFPVSSGYAGLILALLGAAAILWGGVMALCQQRLKILIAYSSVGQLGYLFLPFAVSGIVHTYSAWRGAVYFILAHALAKSAMFLAAANFMYFIGHDRIVDIPRMARQQPLSITAFGLAGVSILGLPPSGGFIAKWLMLEAFINSNNWWLVIVVSIGGLLAAGYIFKVLQYAFSQTEVKKEPRQTPAIMEWTAFGLALSAILLGMIAPYPLLLMDIGNPLVRGGIESSP
jgi:formate hydrogenlyase subunit 3/multisubunit Na+/H+ antiporter MnhD subunit